MTFDQEVDRMARAGEADRHGRAVEELEDALVPPDEEIYRVGSRYVSADEYGDLRSEYSKPEYHDDDYEREGEE